MAKDDINASALRRYGRVHQTSLGVPCDRECENTAVILFVPHFGEAKPTYLCSEHLASSADAARASERDLNEMVTNLMRGHVTKFVPVACSCVTGCADCEFSGEQESVE